MDSVRETLQGGSYIATTDHPKSGFYIMEVWKDIPGYEGLYQVSNCGKIKSLSRIIIRSNGRVKPVKSRILKTYSNKYGYEFIYLSKNKASKFASIHRLVALAFIPNPENKPQINHKDGIKQNNCFENLEWCTPEQNRNHAVRLGLYATGERNCKAKLNELQVRVIRNTSDLLCSELASIFNVSKETIYSIMKVETWKHLRK